MGSIVLNVSPELESLIAKSAEAEGAASSEDWLVDFVTGALQARSDARLEALLLEGVESGEATPMTNDDWQDLHRQLEEHIAGQTDRKHAA